MYVYVSVITPYTFPQHLVKTLKIMIGSIVIVYSPICIQQY